MGYCWQGKTEILGESPVQVLLCSPQISHGLSCDRSRASAMRDRRLLGFSNRDGMCLLRGTNWIFKYHQFHSIFIVYVTSEGTAEFQAREFLFVRHTRTFSYCMSTPITEQCGYADRSSKQRQCNVHLSVILSCELGPKNLSHTRSYCILWRSQNHGRRAEELANSAELRCKSGTG